MNQDEKSRILDAFDVLLKIIRCDELLMEGKTRGILEFGEKTVDLKKKRTRLKHSIRTSLRWL